MTYYLFLSDRHGTSTGTRWAIMGLAVKLSQTVRAVEPLRLENQLTNLLDWLA